MDNPTGEQPVKKTDMDGSGLPVAHLVLATEDFIVFIDHAGDVDWQTSKDFDSRPRKDEAKLNEVLSSAALLETTPNDFLNKKICFNFKRLIAEAIARSLDDDYENALDLLDQAGDYIARRNEERARFWYLLATALTSLVCVLAGLVIWLLRQWSKDVLGETALYCVVAMSCGSLGALLSVTFRLNKVRIDTSPWKELLGLEGCSRAMAGAISAGLAALFVHAGILMPVLGVAERTHTGMAIAGFLAGASERWVSSLVATFEKPGQGKEKVQKRNSLKLDR